MTHRRTTSCAHSRESRSAERPSRPNTTCLGAGRAAGEQRQVAQHEVEASDAGHQEPQGPVLAQPEGDDAHAGVMGAPLPAGPLIGFRSLARCSFSFVQMAMSSSCISGAASLRRLAAV